MDPAAPGFDLDNAAVRLDPSDAMFVDVIHTDVRNGPLGSGLGLQRPCGHIDFYPNGGKQQTGCETSQVIEGNKIRRHDDFHIVHCPTYYKSFHVSQPLLNSLLMRTSLLR